MISATNRTRLLPFAESLRATNALRELGDAVAVGWHIGPAMKGSTMPGEAAALATAISTRPLMRAASAR